MIFVTLAAITEVVSSGLDLGTNSYRKLAPVFDLTYLFLGSDFKFCLAFAVTFSFVLNFES
tara:strand:+ start:1994 stop:2176 length:183 start_codon:yes stop_codon:yes gene_type:complete